jgi:hypothetical protein
LVSSGVRVVCLLSKNDQGSPSYDKNNAEKLTSLGIPVFACTPDQFPDLMSAAIKKQDIFQWLGDNDIVMHGN